MKTYTHFLLLLLACCFSCKTPYKATSKTDSLYKVEASVADTVSSIEKLLKPYRDSLDKSMNVVIGYAEGDFIKMQPSGSLGSLVADAMLDAARSQNEKVIGAVCNYGGIRIPEIKQGNITVRKIFELLPFENELVILEINGKILRQWFKHIETAGGWPISRAYPFEIVDEVDGAGAGISTYHTMEKGFEDESLYYFATNDYVANGGDNCEFLKVCKRTNTGILIRDLMLRYILAKKSLKPDNTLRMRYK